MRRPSRKTGGGRAARDLGGGQVLRQHRPGQVLEGLARPDPDLLQRAHGAVVDLERVHAPVGVVERAHQHHPRALDVAVLAAERLELGDRLGEAAELEVGLEALLEHGALALGEQVGLVLDERLVGEVGEELAAPEREGVAEQPRPRLGVGRVRLLGETLEVGQVEPAGVEPEHVAPGSVAGTSGPRSLRSRETAFWSEVRAVRGGCSP